MWFDFDTRTKLFYIPTVLYYNSTSNNAQIWHCKLILSQQTITKYKLYLPQQNIIIYCHFPLLTLWSDVSVHIFKLWRTLWNRIYSIFYSIQRHNKCIDKHCQKIIIIKSRAVKIINVTNRSRWPLINTRNISNFKLCQLKIIFSLFRRLLLVNVF